MKLQHLGLVCLGLMVISSAAALAETRPSVLTATATTITLRADVWCPYNCEPSSRDPGYMVEIARSVFQPHGLTVSYQTLPWSRTLAEVRAGTIDGAIGASIGSPETRGMVFGEEDLGLSQSVFAVTRGSPRVASIADLATRTLVAIADYSYGDPFDDYIETHRRDSKRVSLLSGDDVTKRLIRLVLSSRADVLIEDVAVLRFEAAQVDGGDRLETSPAGEPVRIGIAFTNARPEGQRYAALLDAGVRQMRADGRLAAILARYGVPDWRVGQ
ncbi:MAG: hypothetical protein EAZ99_17800 [Alphaproteobacteria bacterium]|nr:MAG: hypothetical protein EAZ99_17800 [Alphaproteobacteria bacterium]